MDSSLIIYQIIVKNATYYRNAHYQKTGFLYVALFRVGFCP